MAFASKLLDTTFYCVMIEYSSWRGSCAENCLRVILCCAEPLTKQEIFGAPMEEKANVNGAPQDKENVFLFSVYSDSTTPPLQINESAKDDPDL